MIKTLPTTFYNMLPPLSASSGTSGDSLESPPCRNEEEPESKVKINFSPYRHSVLECLYKHGKIPTDKEFGALSLDPQREKGCRHKLKEIQKAETKAFRDQHSPVTISLEEKTTQRGDDGELESKKKGVRQYYPFQPDPDYDRRPPKTGVRYNTKYCYWKANCKIDGKYYQAYFPVGRFGPEQAYQNAVAWRLEREEEGAPVRSRYPSIPDPDYQSRPPATGVYYETACNRWGVTCTIDGKRHQAYFPVGQYGPEQAYLSAVAWRKKMVMKGASVKN